MPANSFREEPRGPACDECGGTGQVSDKSCCDPTGRDFDCEACDGSGLSCRDCRGSKNGICQSCSVEAVEFLFEGTL